LRDRLIIDAVHVHLLMAQVLNGLDTDGLNHRA
jgi:hypothetical protein